MRYFHIITLVIFLSTILCFATEQIELSSRVGITISLESREYFGLFPQITDYKSAILIKDNLTNYFQVNTSKTEVRIPVSDSSIIAMRFVIDNYEEILRNPRIYKSNPDLLIGLIKVNHKYNRQCKQTKLVMKDKSELSGYILCADSSYLVITPDTVFIPSLSKFQVLNYRDIYSIQNVDYPIIDGTKIIWEENLFSLNEKTLLIRFNDNFNIPPEIKNYISKNPENENINYGTSIMDFENMYQRKFNISLDFSYQWFNLEGLITKSSYLSSFDKNFSSLMSFKTFISGGFNIDYQLLNRVKAQVGYNYEQFEVILTNFSGSNIITANTANFTLYYTLWNSKTYMFQPRQLFVDLFVGAQIHSFKYKDTNLYKVINTYEIFKNEDITRKLRNSYKLGLRMNFKTLYSSNVYLSGFINYHHDYGLIRYAGTITSRYINFILSYGATFGIGLEF